jgi:hypothetical protein
MVLERVKQAIDNARRAEGAGGIVNEDGAFANGLKPIADAVGTFGTAFDEVGD